MVVVSVGAGAAGVVLAAAGVTKLMDPAPTHRLFAALGIGGGSRAARAVGAVELCLGLWLLATGNRWAATLAAVAYLVLVVTVLTLRHRSPTTPCGCFGQWSGPPSARHVVVNVLGASTCALAAATGTAVAPGGGSTTAGALAWWGAVAITALAAVLALGGRRPSADGNGDQLAPTEGSRVTRTSGDGHGRPSRGVRR
jgi:hypothetical protein